MLEKCETLGGYSVLVSKIWECRETMELEDAMKAAIKYCTDNDILRPFLETHSSEVQNMLITEWNLEEAQRAWLAQGIDKGIEIGVGKGRVEGRQERDREVLNLIAKGYTLEDIQKELTSAVRV